MHQRMGMLNRPALGLVLAVAAMVALLSVTSAFAAAPTVTGVSPATGGSTGGTSVTVTGTNFTAGSTVKVGGSDAAVVFVSATELTVTTPPHAPGVADIIVTTADGSSTNTAADNFTYTAVTPTVNSLTPNTGSAGTIVQINGSGLTHTLSVTFDGVAGTSLTNTSDTLISVVAPAHAAGGASVIVNTDGGASAPKTFTYTASTPVVSSVAPASGTTLGGTPIVITGSGFTGATAVSVAGTAVTSFTVASDTTINAVTAAHGAGVGNVVVQAPGGTGTGTNLYTYTVPTLPIISSVSPATGPVAGGTSITITGSGFMGATGVSVGGNAAIGVSVVNDTSITAVTPAGAAAGTVDVRVTTPTGTSTIVLADKFTYTSTNVPTVTAVSPTGGPIAGGPTVTITGTGFASVTGVTFGGNAATGITVTSDTSMTVTSPAHSAGAVDVIVTNANGSSATSAAARFTYGAAPAITSISPTSGGAGTVITITGTGFTGATAVMFDTTSATPTSVSDTQIVVTAPSHASGAAAVTVVAPTGTSASVTFTYASSTSTYTLTFRWSLIVWTGKDGISVSAALKGQETPDNTATNDISAQVTAMFRWNGSAQKWEAYFPGQESIPGAVDFTTLTKSSAYWIAIKGPSSVTWTIEQG